MSNPESYKRGEVLFKKEGIITSAVDKGDYWDVTLASPDKLADGVQFGVKKQSIPELREGQRVVMYSDQKVQGQMKMLEIDGERVEI